MFYQKILAESKRLCRQLTEIQSKLSALPDGKLICSRGKNCFKWYISDGHVSVYLPKQKRELAEQLACKKFLSLKAEILSKEISALEFYLRHAPREDDRAEKLLLEPSGFQELLLPYFKPKSQMQEDWMNESYERNPNYPENLIHKTGLGFNVRSKSEAMIVSILHANRIPFRYECALTLDGTTIYPDFTILHPETSEIFYWEHFGRMDDPAYVHKTCNKLQDYALNGIIPSINLVMTFETKQSPLSYEDISRTVEQYFL